MPPRSSTNASSSLLIRQTRRDCSKSCIRSSTSCRLIGTATLGGRFGAGSRQSGASCLYRVSCRGHSGLALNDSLRLYLLCTQPSEVSVQLKGFSCHVFRICLEFVCSRLLSARVS